MELEITTAYVQSVAARLIYHGLSPEGGSNVEWGPGDYPSLDCIISIYPSGPSEETWPHGLDLVWQWHGHDPSGANLPGASWSWGRRDKDGAPSELTDLIYGMASPEHVAGAALARVAMGPRSAGGSIPILHWRREGELARELHNWAHSIA